MTARDIAQSRTEKVILHEHMHKGTGRTEHAAAELSNIDYEALLALVQGKEYK